VFRLNGYNTATAPTIDKEINNILVVNNYVDGGTIGIEFQNETAVYGLNPDKAHNVVIEGNSIHALSGIQINGLSGVSIVGNTILHLRLDATEVADYGGTLRTAITDTETTGEVYQGIEARPGYGFIVSGNAVDMAWSEPVSRTDESITYGITAGSRKDVFSTSTISDNSIRNSLYGVHVEDTQDTLLANNNFAVFRYCILTSIGGDGVYNDQVSNTGNAIIGNHCVNDVSTMTTFNAQVVMAGGESRTSQWLVADNVIEQVINAGSASDQVSLADSDSYGTVSLSGNRFIGFRQRASVDEGLVTAYVGNYYDSTLASPESSVAAHWVKHLTNRTYTASQETTANCGAFAGFKGSAASGESFVIDPVTQDADMVVPLVSFASGDIPAIDMQTSVAGIPVWWRGSGSSSAAVRKSGFYHGAGSPEGVTTGSPGSAYQNDSCTTTTTCLYLKANGTGNMGWRPAWLVRPSANAAADDTTPSVLGVDELVTPVNTSATTAITQLDDAVPGQQVTIRIGSSSTNADSIADGGNFNLSAAWAPTADDTITLYTPNGTTWYERSRSAN